MKNLNLENKVTLKEAYLIMFDYLDKYWKRTGKPGDIGGLLGELSLCEKEPMDPAVFFDWLDSAKIVLKQEQTSEGYRNADTKFLK